MPLLQTLEPFEQSRITRIRHQLAAHPLMTNDALAELAMRHGSDFVRFHDGMREFRTVFGDILSNDPERKALRKAIDNLGQARVFVQMNAVYHDAIYRPLIDEFLEEVALLLPRGEREFINRDAAAFLASAGSVTPFHLDHEQNFLCHIRGPKTLHVWDGHNRSTVPERALEIFYGEGTLREVRYRDELAPLARVFELGPGDGVFMPMGSPHAVSTGAGITATFSMLLNTPRSVREMEAYRANYTLRRLGVSPTPVGTTPTADLLKARTFRALEVAKAAVLRRPQRPRGRYI
jgi:hypothetical protein